MGKIICDICGTVYPDTAEACPICGYSRDIGAELAAEEAAEDASGFDQVSEEPAAPVRSPRREIFDYDAVNPEDSDSSDTYEAYEDLGDEDMLDDYPDGNMPYFEEPPKSNKAVIVILVVIIIGLIAATGFLFFKYLMPNKLNEQAQTTEAVITEAPTTEPTTEPTIPCTSLVLVDGSEAKLEPGQFWLINATFQPADTTDLLTYVSEDEQVATVSAEGRVTAVAEGETRILVTCGTQQLACTVIVANAPETVAAESTESAEVIAASEEPKPEATEATEAPETTKPIRTDVVLKLKKTDIKFGTRGVTFTLELDCDLEPEDVIWTTSNENIARVDNGLITTVAPGTAVITAKYGEQEAKCIVRCAF